MNQEEAIAVSARADSLVKHVKLGRFDYCCFIIWEDFLARKRSIVIISC